MRGYKAKFVVLGAIGALLLSSCGFVQDQLAGDEETTDATTTVPPAPVENTTTTAPPAGGFMSEGNGLNADDLRVIMENVANSEEPMAAMERLGFVPPVELPDGAVLEGFETEFDEGFRRGEVNYSTEATYSYQEGDTTFNALVAAVEAEGARNGWTQTNENDLETIASRSYEVSEPVEGGDVRISVQDSFRELFTVTVRYSNFSSPASSGLVDPDTYSSWFDGVVPIPEGAAFVGGGAQWIKPGDAAGVFGEPGDTLKASFQYLKRDPLELKDEARELGEGVAMQATEDNGKLILSNDDVSIVYDFDREDQLIVAATFS